MDITIVPHLLSGSVTAPSSKSVAHRALICALLADGKSILSNLGHNNDIVATINAAVALGAKCRTLDNGDLEVIGMKNPPKSAVIDCNESGSTLRFFIPIAAALGVETTFLGKGELPNRPIELLVNLLKEHGISIVNTGKYDEIFTIKGKLISGEFRLPGNVSSQYITGLLFALPILKEDSKILLTTKLESSGYVDLTLETLSQFGLDILSIENAYLISKNSAVNPTNFTVESDYSGAAFWLSAGAIGSDISLKALRENSLQGDKAIVDLLAKFGAKKTSENNIIKLSNDCLNGIEIDAAEIPDLVPILSVVAAIAKGTTQIYNAGRLRIKECDRLAAMVDGLSKLGVDISETEDGLTINGGYPLHGGTVSSYADHRIAMSMAIAATVATEPVTVFGAECVSKSYPDFFEDYAALGGIFHVI